MVSGEYEPATRPPLNEVWFGNKILGFLWITGIGRVAGDTTSPLALAVANLARRSATFTV